MPGLRSLRLCCASFALLAGAHAACAQPPAARVPQLFAVQITTGSNWDPGKPAQDQAHFREHSANLKRLRDAGALVLGARYSDKGLIVLAAPSEAEARAMMDEDPSMKAQVFRYELHPFHVFYGGTVNARPPAARP